MEETALNSFNDAVVWEVYRRFCGASVHLWNAHN